MSDSLPHLKDSDLFASKGEAKPTAGEPISEGSFPGASQNALREAAEKKATIIQLKRRETPVPEALLPFEEALPKDADQGAPMSLLAFNLEKNPILEPEADVAPESEPDSPTDHHLGSLEKVAVESSNPSHRFSISIALGVACLFLALLWFLAEQAGIEAKPTTSPEQESTVSRPDAQVIGPALSPREAAVQDLPNMPVIKSLSTLALQDSDQFPGIETTQPSPTGATSLARVTRPTDLPAPSQLPARKPNPTATIGYVIQLYAGHNAERAEKERLRLLESHRKDLGSLALVLIEAKGEGDETLYRIRSAISSDRDRLRYICQEIRGGGQDCVVLQP